MDFCALNALTIKDRFPVPTLDKFLGDLEFASGFTKVDLAEGFHQIRMAPWWYSKNCISYSQKSRKKL